MDWGAVSEGDDGRIGSSRDDSDGGGTLAAFNMSSSDTLGMTFLPVAIYSAICFLIFVIFRRKCRRVYSPRTIPSLRLPENPSPELPGGWFNWIKPFFAIKNEYIINNCSLDGYFFIRFLRVLSVICAAGVCFVWPILLPVHDTGGNHQKALEALTIGNIHDGARFYAHVAVAWCFYGFVLFMIVRECVYYINLRQAYLLSPNYSERLSSRTVLFTCIPKPYVDEAKLRKLFGDSAKHVWLAKDTSALRALVDDREETANRLQLAEIKLIRLANAARQRCLRKHPVPSHLSDSQSSSDVPVSPVSQSQHDHDTEKGQFTVIQTTAPQLPPLSGLTAEEPAGKPTDPEYTHPYGLHPSLPDVRGSVAALWIPVDKRPYHRPLRNFGRRVDTIRWTRARLKVLNRDIWKLRRKFRGGDGSPLNAAFIEFDSQASAQAAFQILAHHQPLHMSPRYIGLQPDEIIWSALRIRWWEHIMRRFFMMGVIAAAVIFWSIPSAFVGVVSQVDYLAKTFFFLKWITKLPSAILGIIKGLLPALALSWLMAAVPWMLRGCARVAGVPSHALVELFVQHAYFVFQVVQVFLITTLTSAASTAVTEILKNPLEIKDMLSENLPKASNFYLSYILIQCLAAGAAKLANIGDLFRHEVIGKSTANPRRQYSRWRKLTNIHWGSEYPRFTNLGVIAISYSCIAPLVLVFAGVGMYFISYVYQYNLLYVYDSGFDTKGLFYPRALMQLMMGLYLAEICLIGLFALKTAVGPLMLMLVFFIFSALVHISLNSALTPLLYNLPRTLALERDGGPIAEDERPGDDINPAPAETTGGLAADYFNMANDEHDDATSDTSSDDETPPADPDLDPDIQLRGIEGASTLKYTVAEFAKSFFKQKLTLSPSSKPPPSSDPSNPALHPTTTSTSSDSPLTTLLTHLKNLLTPDPSRPPNTLLTFLHPEIYQDFRALQKTINPLPEPSNFNLPKDYHSKGKGGYQPPEMWSPAPKLWLPKDEARVSRQEVAHSRGCVEAWDRGCWLVMGGRGGAGTGTGDGENGDGGGTRKRKGWGERLGVGGGRRAAGRGRGRVVCEMEESPLREERVIY